MLEWDQDLAREKTFKLTLTTAAATDGSTLDGAYDLTFQTSGGPKVIAVSIGDASVAADARVIVTFDQNLAGTINVATLAHVSSGGATISRQGNNQIAFKLRDIPRCGAFTLIIDKGVVGDNGVPSSQGWSQASRISCGTSRVIGYSVQGRPIVAYFFGGGSSAVLFTGGIHGDEHSASYLAQDWVNYLNSNAYKIPAGRQVVIVPALNPDGLAHDQRYNMHNVNIDRNFQTSDWVSDIGISNGQILPGGGGGTPLSEPETQAIVSLANTLNIRLAVAFHAQGSSVSANRIADSVVLANVYAHSVGYATVYNDPERVFGYTLTGELETWLGESRGIPAILIEMPNRTGHCFSQHLNALWQMVNL